jgi:hypothetical protein
MERLYELEYLRRSIAMLPPGRRDALDREKALGLVDELVETQDRLEALRRRLRELMEGRWASARGQVHAAIARTIGSEVLPRVDARVVAVAPCRGHAPSACQLDVHDGHVVGHPQLSTLPPLDPTCCARARPA